jgi:staphylococcal nuclease domain-containing protein 1
MSHIEDSDTFFLRLVDNSYDQIEELMDEFEFDKNGEDLEKPLKKGTLCAAKFSSDGQWYRAKVVQFGDKKGEVVVQFVDFGNFERI